MKAKLPWLGWGGGSNSYLTPLPSLILLWKPRVPQNILWKPVTLSDPFISQIIKWSVRKEGDCAEAGEEFRT